MLVVCIEYKKNKTSVYKYLCIYVCVHIHTYTGKVLISIVYRTSKIARKNIKYIHCLRLYRITKLN